MQTSLKILKKLLGHNVVHFSYPYGDTDQASIREYEIIKNLNFNSALTTRVYPIRQQSPFSLPRIYVGEKTCDKTRANGSSSGIRLFFT